jgi:hypothetical protein
MTKLTRKGSISLAGALVVGTPLLLLGACAPPPPPCDACALAQQAQATANHALATAQEALAAANEARAASAKMYQRHLRK